MRIQRERRESGQYCPDRPRLIRDKMWANIALGFLMLVMFLSSPATSNKKEEYLLVSMSQTIDSYARPQRQKSNADSLR